VWNSVLAHLASRTNGAQFDLYLRDTRGLAYDPGASVLRVASANPFHVPWLEGKFSPAIHTAVAEVLGYPIRVEFVDATATEPANGHARPLRPAPLLDAVVAAPEPRSEPMPQRLHVTAPPIAAASPLNVRYTFETFIVGASNRLAHAASLAIVDQPGQAYNPLFLYGGVGLGKTHLLHAIGHAVSALGHDVVYVSSETFTNQLIEAIRQQRTDDFRL
jgi:chromosomal replication initiator protein